MIESVPVPYAVMAGIRGPDDHPFEGAAIWWKRLVVAPLRELVRQALCQPWTWGEGAEMLAPDQIQMSFTPAKAPDELASARLFAAAPVHAHVCEHLRGAYEAFIAWEVVTPELVTEANQHYRWLKEEKLL